MDYGLPVSLTVNGTEYAIRTGYKCALDAIEVLNDPDIKPEIKTLEVLGILYVDFESMPTSDYEQAAKKAEWYLNGCQESSGPAPKLIDWQQDYLLLAPPISRVLGFEVRTRDDVHWLTFLGAYYEIGDCTFAQVVNIRNKLKTGKKLEKYEKEYLRRNKNIIEFKNKYSSTEKELLARLT